MKTNKYRYVSKSAQETGFALLEVLISILLFSIGILGMVAMQAKAVQYSADADDRARAALLANEIVSVMWQENTVTPTSGARSAWLARVQSAPVAGLPNANGTLSAADANGVVTVSITWKGPYKGASDPSSSYTTQVVLP